ncbi:hypothetical protein C8K30_101697 [Promicromonospora sp. AC04]|uniref:hypothetical protein n=1 Tax=Promicromonospora sp. AC04 TaxID=2135723 RepID=UPI000D3B4D92|nr:hypothetical protein [Promicromonospora sp. AC04]PUB32176.1 hypothetical protein C8K30_101697 [Promicromonospora sp. AC04]
MARFSTYHWQGVVLPDPAHDAARSELESPSSDHAAVQAFVTLLRSGDTAATGIALDHYHYAISMERYGLGSDLRTYGHEALECARRILGKPAVPTPEAEPDLAGASCSSALLIMINRAEQEDSDLIAGALESPANFDAESAAFRSAGRILQHSIEPNRRLVTALSAVVFDELRHTDDRLEALQALAKSETPQALAELERATDLDDLQLQATAARALCVHDFAGHRDRIEEKVASWPADAPHPASDVRDILGEKLMA